MLNVDNCYLAAQILLPLELLNVLSVELAGVRGPAHLVDCTQLQLQDDGVTGVKIVFCQTLQQSFVRKVSLPKDRVDYSIHFYTTMTGACHLIGKLIPTSPQHWRTWTRPWPELSGPTSSVSGQPFIKKCCVHIAVTRHESDLQCRHLRPAARAPVEARPRPGQAVRHPAAWTHHPAAVTPELTPFKQNGFQRFSKMVKKKWLTWGIPASVAVAIKKPFFPQFLSSRCHVQERWNIVCGDGAPSRDQDTGATLQRRALEIILK